MKINKRLTLTGTVIVALSFGKAKAQNQKVSIWLTNPDKTALFEQKPGIALHKGGEGSGFTIKVDDHQKYQPIDGFGFALTGGSAMHIIKMEFSARAALLKELFATDGKNIGISYLRVSIGSSDLNDHAFSYDDLPAGQTDPSLSKFDLGEDKLDVIPVLKEILAINPKIKILGSPWSAPAWMKDNNDTRGGSLKPEFYDAYSRYLVKYIKEMKAYGIVIDATTVQNEPLNPKNNPSMYMDAPQQADYIKRSLGPVFQKAGIKAKIIVYDHNCDRPDYPLTIFNDPGASKYIDGSAFHLYGGKIDTLTSVHNARPEKNLYFTEQMVIDGKDKSRYNISDPVKHLIIGATRNWCRNVLEWNLAADEHNQPHTDRGGCPMCQGAVTIDSGKTYRSVAYYVMAHASKFVRPGSFRIASDESAVLPNVAFVTPDKKKVLIVTNAGPEQQTFNISYKGQHVQAKLNSGAVATYVWQ